MSAAWTAAACTLVSVLCIMALAASDPKRLRRRGRAAPVHVRMPLALLTLAPGLWLAVTGHGVAFLLWIGATAVLGWCIAALAGRLLSPRRDGR
jgi:hypothetical protein